MDHLEEELDEVEPPDEFGGHLNNPTHSKKFNLAAYVEGAARRAGLPPKSSQVVEAIAILEAHGFVSSTLIEELTEKIALEYLKLPIVVWVCLSHNKEHQCHQQQQQHFHREEGALPPQLSGHKRLGTSSTDESDAEDDHQIKKLKKDNGEMPMVIDRIARFCQDIGHDPAFFKVKSSNLVYCLVCNKTFKLHAKGQITRVRRHVEGEGKAGLSRHMHNLICLKEKMGAQQMPMLRQIPVHLLQQAHETPQHQNPSKEARSSTAPKTQANILPAIPSVCPSTFLTTHSITALGASLSSISPGSGLQRPIFSQAMAAIPSLQMLVPRKQAPSRSACGERGACAAALREKKIEPLEKERRPRDFSVEVPQKYPIGLAPKPILSTSNRAFLEEDDDSERNDVGQHRDDDSQALGRLNDFVKVATKDGLDVSRVGSQHVEPLQRSAIARTSEIYGGELEGSRVEESNSFGLNLRIGNDTMDLQVSTDKEGLPSAADQRPTIQDDEPLQYHSLRPVELGGNEAIS